MDGLFEQYRKRGSKSTVFSLPERGYISTGGEFTPVYVAMEVDLNRCSRLSSVRHQPESNAGKIRPNTEIAPDHTPSVFAIDLHTHTRFFHGRPEIGRRFDPIGARLLAWMARSRGLDGIAVTNHDYSRDLPIGGTNLAVIPGIEVTTTLGHLLIVGPDPPRTTKAGTLTPEEAVKIAHENECAAIIAHPFRNSTVRSASAAFDAIEVNGKGTESYDWVKHLADQRDLPLVGGSDAHYPIEVGRAYTLVDAEEPTPESIVSAIRDRRVSACVDRRPFQRAVRAVYGFIHGQKGWIERPEPEPPGIGTPPGEHENLP